MKPKWRKLAAELLEQASGKFSHHGCNDLELPEDWTDAECDELSLALRTANGDPENHEPGHNRITYDWFVMWFLGRELLRECEEGGDGGE